MTKNELKDKLKETIAICDIHHQRMLFAYQSVQKYYPLTKEKMGKINEIDLALFDQLIYRFSKLQDVMGARLFKELLEMLEEDTEGIPFLDILNKMEKFGLIHDVKTWTTLRQARNTVSHEYPFYEDIQVEELNLLPESVETLSEIWQQLKLYAQKNFGV